MQGCNLRSRDVHVTKASSLHVGHPDPCADGRRRAAAFGRALEAHLVKMRSEPGAYGQLGLSDLLEMREDCLREFRFTDVYRCCPAPESHFSGLNFTHKLLTSM